MENIKIFTRLISTELTSDNPTKEVFYERMKSSYWCRSERRRLHLAQHRPRVPDMAPQPEGAGPAAVQVKYTGIPRKLISFGEFSPRFKNNFD
jgi:hypothetical protein